MNNFEVNLEVKSVGKYDVVVCGGGVAGFCAAVGAARNGARVALIEKQGALGGVLTLGGNSDIGLFYSNKKQIIHGIGFEFVSRLRDLGGARFPDFENERSHARLNVMVNPFEAAKLMDDMCLEAGVNLYFGYDVCAVSKKDRESKTKDIIASVIVSSKNGLQAIEGKIFIDCTGDGHLSYVSGAEWELGSNCKEIQPATFRAYIEGYKLEDIDRYQVEEEYKKAIANGTLDKNDYWGGKNVIDYFKNRANNANHIPYDFKSTSNMEIEGRKSAARVVNWARNNVKGAENLKVVTMSSNVAFREWRRIKCEHCVTSKEYTSGQRYPDGISNSFYPIDMHKVDGDSLLCEQLEEGIVPCIPYRALIVKGMDNLLVAGRCIDSDRLANSALRVKASCMAMGHSAGVAASEAVKQGGCIRKVDLEKILKVLEEQHAINPERG